VDFDVLLNGSDLWSAHAYAGAGLCASIVLVQILLTSYVTLTHTMRTILLTFIILALFSPAKNISRRSSTGASSVINMMQAHLRHSASLRHEIDLQRLISELLRVTRSHAAGQRCTLLCMDNQEQLPAVYRKTTLL